MDKKGQKRQGYLSWDEYFMGVAMLSGMRSKDPHSQVGACICLLYTSPSPRDMRRSRMPSSA